MNHVPAFDLGRFHAIAIGSSTGGPGVLHKMVKGLPADMPLPIFLGQHLPPTFTPSFAADLDRSAALTCVHADNGMPVLNGTLYVGVGRQHMRVHRDRSGRAYIEISPDPAHLPYRPSADELFRSCAGVYGKNLLVIVLSGIGRDGLLGATAAHEAGAVVVTQSKATCAVYGMPRACDEAGISSARLDPDDIRRLILQLSPGHRAEVRV